MTTRDGVRLDADIYRPDTSELLPVLLMRQPYGRKIASTVVYAHPSWYAAQGYVVVIQDVRGRGTSEGEFQLFVNEIADGLDTINWASQLPGTTGVVGMYGFSYQGMTQLYAAAHQLSALKTICPSMIAYDLYHDWAYENGAFCLQTNLGWALQLAAETARLKGEETAFQKLYAAARNLPLLEAIPNNPTILKELAPDSFYHDWLTHSEADEYWQQLSPKSFLSNVDLPMLHIGGWFDPYLRGTLNLYQEMARHSQFPQYLIIGPWGHLPWGRKVGAMDYGEAANSPVDAIQLQWFDYFLKGKPTELFKQPSVCLFEMGSNQWRYFDKFPDGEQQIFYLQSQGLATVDKQKGKLTTVKPQNTNPITETLVHDPWRPVPSLGGHRAIPAGAFERSSLDCRTDILTYTSDRLARDLAITGVVFVETYCEADTPSFDLSAVLSEVYADGSVYNFTQGYKRVNNRDLPIKIPLQPTCIKISQGNRLRLSLSGACFPAYSVNSGTGKPLTIERLIEQQVITLTITSAGSRVVIKALQNLDF